MTSFNHSGTEKLIPATLAPFFHDVFVCNLALVAFFSLGISGTNTEEDSQRSLVRCIPRNFSKLFLFFFFTDDMKSFRVEDSQC